MQEPSDFMQLAIEQAKKAPSGAPKVGVVIVKNGHVIATAYRSKNGDNLHAEQCALDDLQSRGIDIRGATVYTTLEPCSNVKSRSKVPCAEQLISARVKEVVIGSYDINPAIYRKGWKALRDAGIVLRDFDEKHREQVKALNTVSDANFLYGAGPVGGARFDYKQNGGSFKIYFDESQKEFINTRWTECGPKSIYAYGGTPGIVALAKYADEFDQVDDPGALDYASHSVDAREGDIVVFKGKGGYVLVKVCEVTVGPPWDTKDTSLKIQFQTRVFSSPN